MVIERRRRAPTQLVARSVSGGRQPANFFAFARGMAALAARGKKFAGAVASQAIEPKAAFAQIEPIEAAWRCAGGRGDGGAIGPFGKPAALDKQVLPASIERTKSAEIQSGGDAPRIGGR